MVGLACEKAPSQPPLPVVVDAAPVVPAPPTSLTPCVVRVELAPNRIALSGGGISGSDVTALRAVAKTCSARVVASDDVTFEDVTKLVRLVGEQGIHEVRLGQPLGQWMSMDLARVRTLWNAEPASALVAAIKERAPLLGADNTPIIDLVLSAIARGKSNEPLGRQSSDRGMFEAIAQIVGLRRATAPVSIDLLERVVLPALQIDDGAPRALSSPSTGVEMFEAFVGKPTAVKGLLGAIPDAELSTPYPDGNTNDVLDGDWIVVAPARLTARLARFDPSSLIARYDRFAARSKLRDDDRVLVDTSTRALVDLAACVAVAETHGDVLVFRALPAPLVELSESAPKLATVVITTTGISVAGTSGPVLSSLPQASPNHIVIEAERSMAYGRIRAVAAALGARGHVTFVLHPR